MIPKRTFSPNSANALLFKGNRTHHSSVVLGGGSGVGRALVELLAARGDRVLTTARDLRDLEALRHDCAVRFGVEVNIEAADLSSPDFDPDAFVESCIHALGPVTHV